MDKIFKRVKVIFTIFLVFNSLSILGSESGNSLATSIEGKLLRPFEIELVDTLSVNKDSATYQVDGFYNKLDSSFLYSLTSNDQFRLFSSLVYQKVDGSSVKTTPDLLEVMYRRKSILSEQKHFFNLDLELKSYYLTNNDFRQFSSLDGSFIPQLVLKKNFTNRFCLEAKFRHMFYFKRNENSTTKEGESRIYLSPSYYVPPGIIFNMLLTYKQIHRVGDSSWMSREMSQDFDKIEAMPSVMVLFNRTTLLQFYLETTVAESYDHRLVKENWSDAMTYGIAAYFTIL